MIYVTHDQVEAMTLGDRICVMHNGKVAQIGTPLEVYQKPANVFVARFLGSPPMNVVPATLTHDKNGVSANFGNGSLAIGPAIVVKQEGPTLLGFRPEDVSLTSGTNGPKAIVKVVELLGAETILAATLENGDDVSVRAPRSLLARPGEVIEFSVDPSDLRLFDRQTGIALTHIF